MKRKTSPVYDISLISDCFETFFYYFEVLFSVNSYIFDDNFRCTIFIRIRFHEFYLTQNVHRFNENNWAKILFKTYLPLIFSVKTCLSGSLKGNKNCTRQKQENLVLKSLKKNLELFSVKVYWSIKEVYCLFKAKSFFL